MTITEAFDAFEEDELVGEGRSQDTIDAYICTRNSLLRSLGCEIHIALLAYGHIIQWKKDMREWGNRDSYIAQQVRNLRYVLTYLKNRGFATLDPSLIKVPQYQYRKTAWLTIEQMRMFLEAIDEGAKRSVRASESFVRDKALFAMQFSSGARISELLQLNRDAAEDILTNKQITVRGKGKKEAEDVLNFDDNAIHCLAYYLAIRRDDKAPMFLSRNGKRLHITTAIQNFHRYLRLAGIKRNGAGATHILRHTFGTDLDLNGMDIEDIRRQMRHTRVATTKTYIHSSDVNRRKDYEKYHTSTPV